MSLSAAIMTAPCAGCGCPIWDHQPIWNGQDAAPDAPLYTRGGCINEPASWTEHPLTGIRILLPARVCPCVQYVAPAAEDGAL